MITKKIKLPICEVCNKNQSIACACVPGVPYSAAYCKECLEINVHPYHILIAGTICIGGLERAAFYWIKMVENTLKFLNKTKEDFNKDVKKCQERKR